MFNQYKKRQTLWVPGRDYDSTQLCRPVIKNLVNHNIASIIDFMNKSQRIELHLAQDTVKFGLCGLCWLSILLIHPVIVILWTVANKKVCQWGVTVSLHRPGWLCADWDWLITAGIFLFYVYQTGSNVLFYFLWSTLWYSFKRCLWKMFIIIDYYHQISS